MESGYERARRQIRQQDNDTLHSQETVAIRLQAGRNCLLQGSKATGQIIQTETSFRAAARISSCKTTRKTNLQAPL